jgi:uncharacterized protein (UPF0332 family)
MIRKSLENLTAARHLLGLREPCTNAAATRAYYSAYHAVWARLEELGERAPEVRDGVRYFPHTHMRNPDHESIADAAERCEALTADEVADLETLRDLRVKADYGPDDVVAAEAQACLRASSAIVNKLVEEEEE